MNKAMKIAVLGDGGWGTTISIILSKKGIDVKLWSVSHEYAKTLDTKRENAKFLPGFKIPKEIAITSDIKEAVLKTDAIFIAAPSKYARSVIEKLKGLDLSKSVIVSVSKGLEEKTLLRISQIIEEVLGPVKLVVLSGPTIAKEVAQGLPAAAVVASKAASAAKAVQELFADTNLRLYTSKDIVGVELGGAIKNVIAIASGIADGMRLGVNAKSALVARGLVEISRLGTALGAEAKTLAGLSGLGDLVTTCVSQDSRNRGVGERLARGERISDIEKNMDMVAEGIKTSSSVYELAQAHKVDMPIASEVYRVIFEGKDPKQALSDLMSREFKEE